VGDEARRIITGTSAVPAGEELMTTFKPRKGKEGGRRRREHGGRNGVSDLAAVLGGTDLSGGDEHTREREA